jgi:hypothetical protein
MSRQIVAAVTVLFGLFGSGVAQAMAQDVEGDAAAISIAAATPGIVRALQLDDQIGGATLERPSMPGLGGRALMGSLYASTAVMQALDIHSTLKGLDRGAVESNPLMAGLTSNKAAFIATKVGVAAGTILAARHVAKRNKVAAALTLVALNSAYAVVVSRNYKIAGGLR